MRYGATEGWRVVRGEQRGIIDIENGETGIPRIKPQTISLIVKGS